MQIGDYTAHVLVDDDELEEHHVELETPTRVTCWIASEAGKVRNGGTPLSLHHHFRSLTRPHRQTFSVQWRCHADTRTKGTVGWVRVDGTFCGGAPIHPGDLDDGDTAELSSIGTDTLKTRDFMFSKIQLSGAVISNSSLCH